MHTSNTKKYRDITGVRKMKKSLLALVSVLFISTSSLFSAVVEEGHLKNKADMYKETAKIVYNREITKDSVMDTYWSFVASQIPSKFVNPFVRYTKDNMNLGIELLGIAKHESNWKWFVGKRNANGSVDFGPMMLNSYNIEDEKFMNMYASNCNRYKYDTDIYYMVICINYYKSLRCNLGPYHALQVYNGGWRAVRDNCPSVLKEAVTTYANAVYKYINKYENAYEEFRNENFTTALERNLNKYAFKVKTNSKVLVTYSSLEETDSYSYCELFAKFKSVDEPEGFDIVYVIHPYIYDRKFYDDFILMTWNTVDSIDIYKAETGEEERFIILRA